MLLLLSCLIIAGLRAEDLPTTHYQLKNSSFCRTFDKSPQCNGSIWLLNSIVVVSDNRIKPEYADKMDYNPGNCSLCINRLNETDSGKKELTVIYSNHETAKGTYILLVEDAVSNPALGILAIHSNLSGEFCNITVNCSVQDDWVWSVCDEDSCTTSQRSLKKVNITVSVENRAVTCSGNNHVSTRNTTVSTQAMCFNNSGQKEQEEKSQPSSSIVIMGVFTLCLFICVICVAKMFYSTKFNHQQTTPARLEQNQPAEAQPQPAPRASTSSSNEATYENVDVSQATQASGQIELGSKQSREVDTIYSFLQASNKTTAGTM